MNDRNVGGYCRDDGSIVVCSLPACLLIDNPTAIVTQHTCEWRKVVDVETQSANEFAYCVIVRGLDGSVRQGRGKARGRRFRSDNAEKQKFARLTALGRGWANACAPI